MFFVLQCVISRLSSAFRVFISDIFLLHTCIHTYTNAQTLTFICYGTGLHLPANICNFNKTKGLNGKQALNKNSSNDKKQKTTSIQIRTKKIIFLELNHRVI